MVRLCRRDVNDRDLLDFQPFPNRNFYMGALNIIWKILITTDLYYLQPAASEPGPLFSCFI